MSNSDVGADLLPEERLSDAELIELPKELMDISFELLYELILVHRLGSPKIAADSTERHGQATTVVRRLDTLNTAFEHLCGEELSTKRGRGEDYVFTPTGEAVVAWSEHLFHSWYHKVEGERARVGEKLRVATTAFTLPILGQLWGLFLERIETAVKPEFVQIRTAEFERMLRKREVDLVLAGLPSFSGVYDVPTGFRFQPWNRETVRVLTNLPPDELPGTSVSGRDLCFRKLVLPGVGFMRDVAERLARSYDFELRPAATISDVYYGVNALRFGLVKGCMLVTESVGKWALNAVTGDVQHPTPHRLRVLSVETKDKAEVVAGLFGREEEDRAADHPLHMFWSLFCEMSPELRNDPAANDG